MKITRRTKQKLCYVPFWPWLLSKEYENIVPDSAWEWQESYAKALILGIVAIYLHLLYK
jgi:hypothetical protein